MDAPPTDRELHSMIGPPPALVAEDIYRIEDSVRSGATPRISNPRPPADVSMALAMARQGSPIGPSGSASASASGSQGSSLLGVPSSRPPGPLGPPAPPGPPTGTNSYSMGAMPTGVSWRYVDVLSHRTSVMEQTEGKGR
jgi:hypothetical protein